MRRSSSPALPQSMSPVHTRNGRTTRLASHRLLRELYYNKQKGKRKSSNPQESSPSRIVKILSHPEPTLRRSLRKRRIPISFACDSTDSDPERPFQMRGQFRSSKFRKAEPKSSQNEHNEDDTVLPRREGLRPRQTRRILQEGYLQDSDEVQQVSSSEDDDVADNQEEQDGDDGEDEEEEEEEEEEEGEEEEEEEDDGEEEGDEGEEREGRRRYALRNRTEVQRFSPQAGHRQIHPRPISKSFQFRANIKRNRESKHMNSRLDRRHHTSRRADDSDDSLLIDEFVQGPGPPWLRGGSSSNNPWFFSGLDLSGFSNKGLNVAATGWGHPDHWDGVTSGTGLQTTHTSYNGGADIHPVKVDDSVGFDQVGGLSQYVQSLKEMVFFPLLYPDFFEKHGISPPRGVLLCGPPGTGKTLVARALASSASRTGQRVNFYMRKGADVLSKWVGEAERQLRMLFEEAQRNQPSIIFFDEIDGLAPVRSSKQEQIHNSIVSTLLALMDGLDSRGQVVVIGATNRIDAIDGALRRPGRFDRELVFSLPDCEARAEILKIHTRCWKDPPSVELLKELAAACVGYCGADLKALCTEAAIQAFRKTYPQVYNVDDQLLIDVDAVRVKHSDFLEAMSAITPAAQRGTMIHSMPLSSIVSSCLESQLRKIMNIVAGIFPLSSFKQGMRIPDDDEGADQLASFSMFRHGILFPFIYRPRLLLCGKEGLGLEHLGPAVLHELERYPVHSLSLPSLLSDLGSRTPEEALVNIFREARRTTPAILYLPQLELWWETAQTQLRSVFLMLLAELPSNLPVLLLGTSKVSRDELEEQVSNLFNSNIYEIRKPKASDREKFFTYLLDSILAIPKELQHSEEKEGNLPELPKAPKKERGPNQAELQVQAEEEQHAIRRLRMCLRDVCNRLLHEKCFSVFHYPMMNEEASRYHAIVQNPMDVVTLLQRVDSGYYLTRSAFLQDLELIPVNTKAYYGDDYHGARLVSKAYALRDAAHGLLSQMDKELVTYCDQIASRGGPLRLTGDEAVCLLNPVTRPVHVTRVSARLRGFQPEIDGSQNYVQMKRSKRASDIGDHGGEEPNVISGCIQKIKPSSETHAKGISCPAVTGVPQDEALDPKGIELSMRLGTEGTERPSTTANEKEHASLDHNITLDQKNAASVEKFQGARNCIQHRRQFSGDILRIKRRFVKYSRNFGVSELEKFYTTLYQVIRRRALSIDEAGVVSTLEAAMADPRFFTGNSEEYRNHMECVM